jgi:maleate isomerase
MAATEQPLLVNRRHMPFELDGGVAPRAAIGLIVLATDNTIEHEFRQIVPRIAGAAVFHTRILNDPDINPTTLRAMESRLADCSRTLRPGERIDVVAYGCTSASMVIGPAGVAARVHEGRPDVPVTNPVSAAVAGLGAMGAKRIALLTPYIDEVNQGMRNFFVGQGLEVPVMGSFNHADDNEVARISERSIEDALVELGSHDDVDGVFISCTSLRVCGIVERAEERLGKPITSSNHALAWHALRLAGVDESLDGLGRLFRTPLP